MFGFIRRWLDASVARAVSDSAAKGVAQFFEDEKYNRPEFYRKLVNGVATAAAGEADGLDLFGNSFWGAVRKRLVDTVMEQAKAKGTDWSKFNLVVSNQEFRQAVLSVVGDCTKEVMVRMNYQELLGASLNRVIHEEVRNYIEGLRFGTEGDQHAAIRKALDRFIVDAQGIVKAHK
jgi:hypothetical protein